MLVFCIFIFIVALIVRELLDAAAAPIETDDSLADIFR
jgi:hypothetical protein